MIHTLGPDGFQYRIHDPGGNGRVAKAFRAGQPYEHVVLEDMAAHDITGSAVDVGANIGNHTLWMVAVMGLHVTAFEPVRFAQLTANLELNGVTRLVDAYPRAVGATNGGVDILGPGQKPYPNVACVRLDDMNLTDVGLLKIDVEGMEPDVLTGATNLITESRPLIYAEAWNDTALTAIGNILEPLGYTHTKAFRWNQHRWTP